MSGPHPIDAFGAIAGEYDAFLVDQWGVLHDGHAAFPDAVEAMRRLRAAGRTLVVLSNSSRRVSTTRRNMTRIGLDPALFDDIVTSGEEVWEALKRRDDPFYAGLGRRCLVFQWGKDEEFFEGLDLEPVETVEEAGFILLNGTEQHRLHEYDAILRRGVERGLPLVCANQDFVSVTPAGELVECPGTVARRYDAMGGLVRWHGKPSPGTYRRALAGVARDARVLAIGDSLFHDIGGAAAAGIESLFIVGGIHRFELGLGADGRYAADRLATLCADHAVTPTWVASKLSW